MPEWDVIGLTTRTSDGGEGVANFLLPSKTFMFIAVYCTETADKACLFGCTEDIAVYTA